MIIEHTEINYVRVYDKGVIGCLRNKKEINENKAGEIS